MKHSISSTSYLISFAFTALLAVMSNVLYSQSFTPGQTYFDSSGYVEYRAGNLPIILSAPHGGSLQPAEIPDRDCAGCVYVKDTWTKEITEGMYDEFVNETGCYPHIIINLLHRRKFDANRDIGDAADGNATVEMAWQNYHDFIEAAETQVQTDYGKGLFLDIHGHAHTIQRIELGYLLSGSELALSDDQLNTDIWIQESSIRSLAGSNIQGLSHAQLLRGAESFGSLMHNKNFPSVPSATEPFPNDGEPYFSGGYNTQRHGSVDGVGTIDAIQLELNSNIRFDSGLRASLISALKTTANEYIDFHYNNQYSGNYCNLILGVNDTERNNQKFKIYPNPASGYFILEGDLKNVEIIIYNSSGQRIHSEFFSNPIIQIDHLPQGFYHVQLKKDNTVLDNLKLIKD